VTQVGCELIGSDAPESDAELIDLAADALIGAGVANVSVDISLPTVVPAVFESLDLPESVRHTARLALDRKDAREVAALGGPAAAILGALLDASGDADRAIAKLSAIDLPAAVQTERDRLARVIDLLRRSQPSLGITVDPVEHRGFEYQTGLSFTLFAKGVRGELGRGGRYHAGDQSEPASGFSLYLDSVLRALPAVPEGETVYLPFGTPPETGATLRDAGWTTQSGLEQEADAAQEAKRLGCTHILNGPDGPEPL